MKWTLLCLVIVACALRLSPSAVLAQAVPADEPDTAAFIDASFQLQDTYARVLCVEGDAACPAEVTTAVPCLTASCSAVPTLYPVSETFQTIQDAADSAQPGDLILIMPGRHRGIEVEQTGGDDGAYIHLLGWGDPGTIIVDEPARPDVGYLRHHFYFIAAHHYIIQNIAFEGADRGAGLFMSGNFGATGQFAHHFIISNVYSHANGEWGLHTTATNTMLIQDSIFTTASNEHGVYISGSGDQMVIRRNVFQNNNAGGLQVNADPQSATIEVFYWLQTATGDTCGWTEADVEFTGAATWDDLKACYDQQGLPDLGEYFEDGISEGFIIEQNVATGNGAAGGAAINLASVRNSIVRNNLIYGNRAAGIACWDNAYAEEKGLPSSQFGCADVTIANNTVVDETGNRGALILNRDNRDLTVVNNIIIRDRDDAYELAERSGQGLRSSHNLLSALTVEDSPGTLLLDTDAGSGSIVGVSVTEALSHFVSPGFAPWLLENANWPTLNPDRPDYHLRRDSDLIKSGNPAFAPTLDANASPRGNLEIGALTIAGTGSTAAPTAAAPVVTPTPDTPAAEPAPVMLILPAHPADLFVDDDNATGIEDGSARNPYPTVQQAVDAASDGAIIAVAAGTYAENVLVMNKAVQLYGGYVGGTAAHYAEGTGGDFTVRDAAMLSDLQGNAQDTVVTLVDAGASVVDGFRISGGTRTQLGEEYCCWGGGVYISGGAPTIANNLIEDNNTLLAAGPDDTALGGGIYAQSAQTSILNNLIRNNTSGRGGGIAINGGDIVIRGNTVEANIGVSDHGGGIYVAAEYAEISHNRIIGNEIGRELGYGWGGGVIVYNPGTATMFSYNIITGNYAPSLGSGVFVDDGAYAVLDHELIYANACTQSAGVGIYVDGAGNGGPGSTVQITNTTVADHDCETALGGNAIYAEQDSVVTVQNSIFWGNGADDIATDDTSNISVRYTLSGETIVGTGNLSADPRFADAASHDYHLRSTVGRWSAGGWVQDSEYSPAIDAGDPASPFDAEPAPNGGQVNLGAYGNTPEASLSARDE